MKPIKLLAALAISITLAATPAAATGGGGGGGGGGDSSGGIIIGVAVLAVAGLIYLGERQRRAGNERDGAPAISPTFARGPLSDDGPTQAKTWPPAR